jgi:alginate O-acetyltransferase complex protein AlgJ
MVKKKLSMIILCFCISSADNYIELVPQCNRLKSTVIVRKIEKPSLANLDFAAYDKNPILMENSKEKPRKIPVTTSIDSITFGNVVLNVKDNLNQTPLTETEWNTPLAWKPLIKKLWGVVKDDKLQQLGEKVASYKWADPEIYLPYQEITTAYIHEERELVEFWVKVEFSHWVSFLKSIDDEDKDGFREIYGKLDISGISPDSLQKAVNWIKNNYTKKILSSEEMTDWVIDLASYWYPTKNTDILELGDAAQWPLPTTNKKVLKELKGQHFNNPLAVIEGKPVSPDKPIYNVFLVNQQRTAEKKVSVDSMKKVNTLQIDTSLSENLRKNNDRFRKEVSDFGTYEEWYQKNTPFLNGISNWVATFPADQMGFEGMDGWLFFRKSFEYMLGKDYTQQTMEKNPLPHLKDFKNYLKEKDVNLLFVVVPNKEEVYYDKISSSLPAPKVKYVNPYSRKILSDLQNAGIEVIDLLPYFLEARNSDTAGGEYLYQLHDTHWTNRGLQIAAGLIAERVKNYSWYSGLERGTFIVKDTSFERQGDIVERLPEQNRSKYPAVRLHAQQVYINDSVLYKGNNANAPIMLIGDSFTGVFESVDCKSAGVGANIAQKTGVPVDIITSWGGGPLVRSKAMRVREKNLPLKKLVIYMMVARDLYNYSQNWDKFPE